MDSKDNLNGAIRDCCCIPNNSFSTNLLEEKLSTAKSSTEGTVSYDMEKKTDSPSFSGSCFLSSDLSYLVAQVIK